MFPGTSCHSHHLPHRQLTSARNDVGQLPIAYSLPAPASFSCSITTSNTETTQSNCTYPSTCTAQYCTVWTQPTQDKLSIVPVALGVLCLQRIVMQTLCAALLWFFGMTFGYLEHWEFVTQEEEIIKLTSSWFNTLILKLK